MTLSDVAPLETEAREPNATNGDESRTGQETDESTGEIAPAHKVFLLALDREGIRFHLAGREADLQLRDIGPVVETRNVTRQRIVPEATELLARLFRPLAEIEAIEGKDAALRLQAADLRPGTINVRKASLLRPVLRFRDPRTGEIRKHQSIRWTYLRVTQRKRYRCRAQVLSGIRSPLGQKRMRLVDRFALLARPAFEQTECTLYPQGESETRLVGYRVLALPPRPIDEDEDSEPPDPLQLLTDYRGRVVIERNPDVPLYWLSVRSGKSRLATVPFVPGLHETLDIPLPNDRVRLAVDGQLALLEGDLVSVIAERALLTSLARKAARRGDNEQADEYVREIANLPTLRSMTNRLNLIRVEGKQRAGGDRIAVALIDRECDRLLGVLRRYLNQSRMEDLRNELDELKEVYNSDRRERRAVEREG